MKLVLGYNQSDKFVAFFTGIKAESNDAFDYVGYQSLLFRFDTLTDQPVDVIDVLNGKHLSDYDGVYINNYMPVFEVAASTAIACEALGIPFINKELANPPSLSKLTSYAKLAKNNVHIPKTVAGLRDAILKGGEYVNVDYPAVLKRADADRGIDNYKVDSYDDVTEILEDSDKKSIWILQNFIENDGFYLVCYYDSTPVFSIFRTLEKRSDGNARKAHMFKPVGGINASLIELSDVPTALIEQTTAAMKAMNRQICSVDALIDVKTKQAYIMEVNYNPQFATIESFKDIRIKAFIDNLNKSWM